jgi:hypothetical protein
MYPWGYEEVALKGQQPFLPRRTLCGIRHRTFSRNALYFLQSGHGQYGLTELGTGSRSRALCTGYPGAHVSQRQATSLSYGVSDGTPPVGTSSPDTSLRPALPPTPAGGPSPLPYVHALHALENRGRSPAHLSPAAPTPPEANPSRIPRWFQTVSRHPRFT